MFGAVSTGAVVSRTVTVKVFVDILPAASFAVTVTVGGTTLCLDANGHGTTNGTKAIVWACNGQANQQWNLNSNGSITGGQGTQTLTYTAGASGTVGLMLNIVEPGGCHKAASTNVTINPIPATPTITPGGPTTFCAGGSVTLDAGAEIMGPSAPFWAQAKELALAALGPSKFEAEFTAGNRMRRDAAVRLALGESHQDEVEAGADVAPGPLAKREVEVAQLIAEGLSNKRIGAQLFISEATVATHVRNIMNKLGINSRAQIAGWMASGER